MKKTLMYFSLLALSLALLVSCSINNKATMTGIYLKSTDEIHLIIDETNQPITMNNATNNKDIFNNLRSGDKIEITYDSIAETYPASTNIYSCKFIESGTVNNISQDLLTRLEEIGWTFDLSN